MTSLYTLKRLRNDERYYRFLLVINTGGPPCEETAEDYRAALRALEDGINDAINHALNG